MKIRFLMKFTIIKWKILSTYYKYFSQNKNLFEINKKEGTFLGFNIGNNCYIIINDKKWLLVAI